jgi:phosphatidylglycerophosphate synthase
LIAALICVASVAAFMQFLVSYCRSVVSAFGKLELSARVREVAGMGNRAAAADDFARFLQLLHLCPEHSEDRMHIQAVKTYYALLRAVGRVSRMLIPGVAAWTDQERTGCSHFAAVALDRRMEFSRDLFARQASGIL